MYVLTYVRTSLVGLMLVTNRARRREPNPESGAEAVSYETPVPLTTQYTALLEREEQTEGQDVHHQQVQYHWTCFRCAHAAQE